MDVRFYKKLTIGFQLFLFMLFSQLCYGQLADFSLQVSATNETCTANGALSFNATNTEAGAIILYRIYKLPNLVTPIVVTNSNNFGGLTAGTYRIIAIQSLGNLSNTQQQDIQITNLIVPVTFQIVGQPALYCGTTGTVTVNANQGNPVLYEIISGPIIIPTQASNVFTGLPPGDYDIRVIDACGDGVVQTYHLPAPPPNLTVALNQNCSLVDCNTKAVEVMVNAAAGTQIGYPLQVQLTITAQGGQPIIFNQTLTSGNSTSLTLPFQFGFNDTANYTANVSITDACGNIKTLGNFFLQVHPELNIGTQPVNMCSEQMGITTCNMQPPLTVNFLSSPAGFNPANFNPDNLGPFNTTSIVYASTPQNELPEGHYVIQVTDSCGRTVQGGADIIKGITDHKLVFGYQGCDLKAFVFIPNVGISPATVILTSAPSGYNHSLPYDVSFLISGGIFSMELPLLGTYVFTGINVCGDIYTRTVTVIPPEPILRATGDVLGCGVSTGKIKIELLSAPAMASVILVQAPPGFDRPLPFDVSEFIGPPSLCTVPGLPIGTYVFIVTDICGTVYPPVTGIISPGNSVVPPTMLFLRGCAPGFGSMKMQSPNGKLLQVIITTAPAAYTHPLPYDVSFNIEPTGSFYMNSLPAGSYIFHIKDICNEQDVTFIVPGVEVLQNDITVVGNCGSFNLIVFHRVDAPYVQGLWLQKYNPQTGQWEHPITGVPYVEDVTPTVIDSYWLENNTTNYNIASLGTFRVLKYSIIYSNGRPQFDMCFTVIKEFVFTGELKIDSASAVPCNNTSNDVVITAGGIPPFTYKITTKDGVEFLVDNGSSNFFPGLAPAIYNFQVEDQCGNIVNRLFDITTLSEPEIVASDFCSGQNGQLSVPAVSFLSYQWWKSTDSGNILSTTNTLNFNPFSNATSPGIYFVRIYSTSNLSCIDITISYVVPAISLPNAGLDGATTICGNDDPIDLFTLLGAPYDSGGIWHETSNSGTLSGNTWSPAGVPFGTYTFAYGVSALCGINDEAVVTIHYNAIPEDPIITVAPNFCTNQTIQLHVGSIANATYEWAGPNGFTSNLQNPTIANSSAVNGGLYSVKAIVNGCESNASTELHLQPMPDFELKPSCVNNVYTVSVTPVHNSFNVETATYSWTGPNGFTSTENPVELVGLPPGLYEVTVTNPEGCPETHSIPVVNTLCNITNVITPNDDGNNESFDLTGLDVDRIEIYSRWGRLVYEQNNYTDQWHGQNMHNGELPDSTYYYILYLRSGVEKQGWVYKFSWRN
jgi:gliding motility-associated-like protein